MRSTDRPQTTGVADRRRVPYLGLRGQRHSSELRRDVAHRARDISHVEGALPEHDPLLIDGTGLSMPDTPEKPGRFAIE